MPSVSGSLRAKPGCGCPACVTDCRVERSVLTGINEYVMLCYILFFHHCTRTVFDILDAGAGAGESEDEDEDEDEEGKKKGKKKGKGKSGDESGEDEEEEDGKSKKKKKKGDRDEDGGKGKKGTGASDGSFDLVPFDTIGT